MTSHLIKRAENHLPHETDTEKARIMARAIAAAYEGNPKAIQWLWDNLPPAGYRYALEECPEWYLEAHGLHPTPPLTIHCGLSAAFHNKELKQGFTQSAYGNSFEAREVKVAELIAHIRRGGAFTPGAFKTNRRIKENFVQAQMLALDLDDNVSVTQCIIELLICEYAAIVYPTPSSTPQHSKTRVVFILDEPVTDLARWEAMQRALIAHYAHLRPDPQCKDASRLFFGSDVGVADMCPRAVLPIQIAQRLADIEADRERVRQDARRSIQPKREDNTPITDERKQRYLDAAIDDELAKLRSTPSGTRNRQLFNSACALFSFAKGNWGVSRGQIERELHSAASSTGLPDYEIHRTLDSAWKYPDARAGE